MEEVNSLLAYAPSTQGAPETRACVNNEHEFHSLIVAVFCMGFNVLADF